MKSGNAYGEYAGSSLEGHDGWERRGKRWSSQFSMIGRARDLSHIERNARSTERERWAVRWYILHTLLGWSIQVQEKWIEKREIHVFLFGPSEEATVCSMLHLASALAAANSYYNRCMSCVMYGLTNGKVTWSGDLCMSTRLSYVGVKSVWWGFGSISRQGSSILLLPPIGPSQILS